MNALYIVHTHENDINLLIFLAQIKKLKAIDSVQYQSLTKPVLVFVNMTVSWNKNYFFLFINNRFRVVCVNDTPVSTNLLDKVWNNLPMCMRSSMCVPSEELHLTVIIKSALNFSKPHLRAMCSFQKKINLLPGGSLHFPSPGRLFHQSDLIGK